MRSCHFSKATQLVSGRTRARIHAFIRPQFLLIVVNTHSIKFAITIFKCTFSNIKYIHIVVQPNSRMLFILQNRNPILIKHLLLIFPFVSALTPGNHHSSSCLYEFDNPW